MSVPPHAYASVRHCVFLGLLRMTLCHMYLGSFTCFTVHHDFMSDASPCSPFTSAFFSMSHSHDLMGIMILCHMSLERCAIITRQYSHMPGPGHPLPNYLVSGMSRLSISPAPHVLPCPVTHPFFDELMISDLSQAASIANTLSKADWTWQSPQTLFISEATVNSVQGWEVWDAEDFELSNMHRAIFHIDHTSSVPGWNVQLEMFEKYPSTVREALRRRYRIEFGSKGQVRRSRSADTISPTSTPRLTKRRRFVALSGSESDSD